MATIGEQPIIATPTLAIVFETEQGAATYQISAQQLLELIAANMALKGLAAARPLANVAGRLYYATDTQVFSRDNGSSWDAVTLAQDQISGLSAALAAKAALASPALTGTPTAPTAAPGTDTTQIATTAFVLANVGSGGGAVDSVNGQTGDVVLDAGDVGADPSGTAAGMVATEASARAAADTTNADNLTTHAALTTSAHGGIVASDDSRLTDSRAPSGTAGGVLGGTYPNPSFAADMATQAELDAHTGNTSNPHSVTAAQVGAYSTSAADAAFQPIDADLTAIAAITSTGVLQRTGSNTWAAAALIAADIPNLAASKITSGQLAVAQGGTGVSTASANTVFSGPASGSAAAPAFRALVRDDLPSDVAQNPPPFYEDFIWGFGSVAAVGSGAGSVATTQDAGGLDLGGHPGQLVLGTGTTTTGRATAGQTASAGATQLLLGYGAITWETDIFIVDGLSDGTETYLLLLGFNDLTTGTGTDAVLFRYTHSVNSGKFECVTRSNSVETATDSGIAAANTTWYKLRIEINAAASSVAFYINGSLVATNTTNIPTGSGRQTSPMLAIIKSAGTTARRLAIDYIYTRIALTTSR